MRKFFLFLVVIITTTAIWAFPTRVDDIYYEFNTEDKTAVVTVKGNVFYSGSVTIPEQVTNNMIDDAVNIISSATKEEQITDYKLKAMTIIGIYQTGKAEGIGQGKTDALGPLGEEKPGTALRVTKGEKEVILYAPDKVEYIIRK